MAGGLSLADVIGGNAHTARTNSGVTLDQVAVAARARGLKWSESRVADFESGRVAPSLATLITACLAYSDAGCANATLPALVKWIVPIEINDALSLWSRDIVKILAGEPVRRPRRGQAAAPKGEYEFDPSHGIAGPWEQEVAYKFRGNFSITRVVQKASGATEARVSKALGISPMLLSIVSAALWERSFSKERDRRAGDGANAQKRGQVTRQLRAELTTALEEAATRGNGK